MCVMGAFGVKSESAKMRVQRREKVWLGGKSQP